MPGHQSPGHCDLADDFADPIANQIDVFREGRRFRQRLPAAFTYRLIVFVGPNRNGCIHGNRSHKSVASLNRPGVVVF
jgi:hypothetical protein